MRVVTSDVLGSIDLVRAAIKKATIGVFIDRDLDCFGNRHPRDCFVRLYPYCFCVTGAF